MRYWPKTEKASRPDMSVTVSADEMARILRLPPGAVIKDVWTSDYASHITFTVGVYSDSQPPA